VQAIADGSAFEAYERWIRAQGGDPSEDALATAPVVREVAAPRTGYVSELGAVAVGQAALHLGAGRRTKDDSIDHAVGVVLDAKRGDRVAEGEPLAEIHAATEAAADEAAPELLAAYTIGDEPPPERPVVLDVLT
jgi:pyrimidine-nucleoside phosphorylase